MRNFVTGTFCALLLSSCTLFTAEEEDVVVSIVSEENVQNCVLLGNTQAVYQGADIDEREALEIAAALLADAKNAAVSMGGDTVVEQGPLLEDRQAFAVYRCAAEELLEDQPVIGVDVEKTF